MKFLLLVICAALFACSTVPTVGPKPDVVPTISSNQATKKSIGESRKEIKKTQNSIQSGDDKLKSVNDTLIQLLRQDK